MKRYEIIFMVEPSLVVIDGEDESDAAYRLELELGLPESVNLNLQILETDEYEAEDK